MARDGKFSLDDYVDVAERLQDFKDAYPEGTCQTISWYPVEVDGKHFIVYHAAAYRTPDDPRPGHGIAWEPFPGRTPYTKDSELMNAETAAWGRAIVALGLVANRKLASRQEVRNRVEDQAAEATEAAEKPKAKQPPKPKPKGAPSDTAVKQLLTLYESTGLALEEPGEDGDKHAPFRLLLASHGAANAGDIRECVKGLNRKQFEGVWQALEEAKGSAA